MDIANKRTIGLVEKIVLFGKDNTSRKIIAKIDTGATKSSMDVKLAEELHLGPVIKSKMVKSAHGSKLRPLIEAEIEIARQLIKTEFTLADRDHMKYRVLIGQNILKKGFLIDPLKE